LRPPTLTAAGPSPAAKILKPGWRCPGAPSVFMPMVGQALLKAAFKSFDGANRQLASPFHPFDRPEARQCIGGQSIASNSCMSRASLSVETASGRLGAVQFRSAFIDVALKTGPGATVLDNAMIRTRRAALGKVQERLFPDNNHAQKIAGLKQQKRELNTWRGRLGPRVCRSWVTSRRLGHW